jgi:hypothetical protein
VAVQVALQGRRSAARLCLPPVACLLAMTACARPDPVIHKLSRSACSPTYCNGYYVGADSGRTSPEFAVVQAEVASGLLLTRLPPNLTPALSVAPPTLPYLDSCSAVGWVRSS